MNARKGRYNLARWYEDIVWPSTEVIIRLYGLYTKSLRATYTAPSGDDIEKIECSGQWPPASNAQTIQLRRYYRYHVRARNGMECDGSDNLVHFTVTLEQIHIEWIQHTFFLSRGEIQDK